MNIIVLLFLVARSAFATDVSTKHSKETLPFDIYDRINDFADVKTSARFRSAKKYLYRSLKLHPDVLFHWFGKCGPFFNGVNCGQSAIKKFYSKYKNVMDPNDNFGNNNISKEDFIGMLIKRREFTPFNCYIYNAESKLRAIHPLEYCMLKNIEDCVQILQSRGFYVESMTTLMQQIPSSNLFTEEALENIAIIDSMISNDDLSQYDLRKYTEKQSVNLQPIDQTTMLNVLKTASRSTSPDSNLLRLGVWMLQNHINALSYSGFNKLIESIYFSRDFIHAWTHDNTLNPTVIAILMKEILKTNFQMKHIYRVYLFKKYFLNRSVLTDHKETFLEIIKHFPRDGQLLAQLAFSECNPTAYKLLKQSNIFFHFYGYKEMQRNWRDLFQDILRGDNSEKEVEKIDLLLASFDDVDKAFLYGIKFMDIFENYSGGDDQGRTDLFKKILHYEKDNNYNLFVLKFHEASLNPQRGDRNLEFLIKLVGGVPKPQILLSNLITKNLEFPLEKAFKLVVPFLEDDNEKVDLLSTLQIHNNINESSRLSCFKIVFHSILDPQKRETFQYAEEMKPNKVNFEKRKKMRELLDNY
ncbi:hypothetical protein O9G_001082 [Rozella allomycis CSF55]|uniref:Uncharacterized protein n=1 Tax=Rozella allomycis (strain CSF55) TaxID=988480 RepID=A0A075AN37_ROZAC|nr:hypothetical protein O9G_001082 [Rozella allomycis CSF55]|eukprot:EPZ31171.1 hypothetical protein O9G_001082 [Rozella allomycis CSF55]